MATRTNNTNIIVFVLFGLLILFGIIFYVFVNVGFINENENCNLEKCELEFENINVNVDCKYNFGDLFNGYYPTIYPTTYS